ncbi:hypothetical protein GPECTOR_79g128 [Gonium pectorale]|uniref:U2A'/phosphoprotein 32 family A C-terminal domain-containing protein n=1 Tax=Gonium pectorale TaxID=33097 RepID=A0A150G1U8_GONPE|nr:hypothetical protein GPECTOR_79g128 [Gonium pectorale]|eukprot:KXZ43849.1 hypothetical protein GPECTOR_79g128 [Gonium pectorale]
MDTEREQDASLSCIGQGLLAIGQVPELPRLSNLQSLCLHGNNITRVEGLQHLTNLVDLNLSSNALASIDPGSLRALSRLTSLNLASNRLQTVQGLNGLSNLEQLNLSYNYITSLGGLSVLQGPLSKLRVLNLKHNQLSSLQAFSVLVGCMSLRWLQVAGNPVCQLPNYMQALVTVLSQVTRLDALSSAEALSSPYDAQAAQQFAAMRLKSFEPSMSAQLPQPARAVQPVSTRARMPGMDHMPSSAPHQPAWQAPHPENSGPVPRPPGHGGMPYRPEQAQPALPSWAVKVIVADATAQTSEYTPLVQRLQKEALEMRQQLTALTDELEKRNANEESLRAAMQEAVTAAQEEAHRRVEEGFREASFAVSKALLRGELQRLNAQLLEQQSTAAAALEEERRRGGATEAAVREQLAAAQAGAASAATELSVMRAAAAAAEQKVASLEAALKQSSTTTMSMTAQIAQTMAEANAQIDVLKARLGTMEQQLADHQRREVDARAEINALTSAVQGARTQHARELEAVAKLHEDALKAAVEKERAAAEERGKAAAMQQVQAERSALHEQIAFLKVQLQFAIKESDKEHQAAQAVLRTAQAEAVELRAALQAAVAKQREGEALVSDFTGVVQQQKAAIQALQRDKEALATRLKACGPDAFEALAAENLRLKRDAAERDMYREQADDARRRWQEVERRLTETQVSASRTADELTAKLRAAESALVAAREEAGRADAVAERLRQDVAAQQDVVKIKVAMLDSANDTIASLKAEIADLQAEVDEARRAAEEAEAALAREQQQADEEDAEKTHLRQQLAASEAAAAAARSALVEAQARLKEAEGRLRTAGEAVAEKDRMIKYVEEEVDRVKELFEKREQRLRDERDAARVDAEAAREAAASQVADANARLDRLSHELERARGQLEDAALQLEEQRRVAMQANGAAAERAAESQRLSGRVAELEAEMRGLLEAVERHKATSAHKMRQLASLLQEL